MKEEKDKKKVDKKTTPKKVTSTRKKTTESKTEINKIEKEKVKVKESDTIISNNAEFNLLEVVIIVLITGIVVSITSGLIVYKNYDKINITSNSINNRDELSEFIDHYNYINDNYVEEIDKKELIEAAIKGMYNQLKDGYSMYMSKEDTSSLEEQLTGEYTGIGIEIRSDLVSENKYITTINKVFNNTPAKKAGLKVGDIIKKIDDIEVDISSTVADTIKKGNKETYDITIERDGKEKTFTIKREKVYIESVTSEIFGNTGYIKIDTFSATTESQITKIIKAFNKNIDSLVIDVRDNTGGYLSTAYEVSDLFVKKGNPIYQLKDKNGNITKYNAKSGILRDFKKIAVIINESSASASEILTLALKESAGATVVGMKSFGKGTVQETKTLSSGAMVKYTTSYWLSPNGNSINNIGIKPDIEEKDTNKQLEMALKAVK